MKTSNPADIILYGGPASGKSTQAERLAAKLKAAHMNMGGLLRAEIAKKNTVSRDIKKYVDAGKLVPELISSRLVSAFIKKVPANQRIVFDGYPRRMLQVKELEPMVKRAHRHTHLVFIDLPVRVAKDRISKRAKLEGRLDDANPKVVAERIQVFKKNADPVLKFYRQRRTLTIIKGDQTIPEVHQDIVKQVAAL